MDPDQRDLQSLLDELKISFDYEKFRDTKSPGRLLLLSIESTLAWWSCFERLVFYWWVRIPGLVTKEGVVSHLLVT